MKKLLTIGILILPAAVIFAQEQQRTTPPAQPKQEYPARMTPQMTEFFEPEVKIIQPAAVAGMAPSDAIILFVGSDVN